MKKVLSVCALFASMVACGASADMPARAEGTFVQKKILADVDVVLISTGTYVFERDRSFTWKTEKPVASVFVATPTNWSFTVRGKTTSRPTGVRIDSPAEIFAVKEVASLVDKVVTEPSTGFPMRVVVTFKNADKLDIALAPLP